MMDVQTYVRKTFEVQAVQITEDNFADVARWAGTCITIDWQRYGDREHILLRAASDGVNRYMISAAFVGDWITLVDGKFRRVPNKKFTSIFELRSDSNIVEN